MSRDPEDGRDDPPPPEPDGTIEVTSWTAVAVMVVFGALGGWITVRAVEAVRGVPPQLPGTLVAVLWAIAAAVAVVARLTHVRVHVEHRWVAARFGIGLLALGKSATVLGALGAGFLVVFAALFVDRIMVPVSAWRVLLGAVGAAGCVVAVFAGRALERACHIPDDPDDPPSRPRSS